MKILIATMTCGEGHNAFARTIYDECARRGHECELYDIFSYNRFSHALNDKGFVLLTKYFRKPYSIVWEHQFRRDPEKRYRGIFANSLRKLKKVLLQKIGESAPDVVFCTHYYASAALSMLKHEGKLDVPFYFMLTDYFTYPNVEVGVNAKKIFVGSSHAVDMLKAQGYRDEQIVITGLPVRSSFVRSHTKAEARAELGIPDKFTVLCFAGSNGELPAVRLLKNLEKFGPEDVSIVFIAGRNAKEKKKADGLVSRGKLKKTRVYGFVDNMNVFMSASDCVICKASGGALSECAKMGVPVVIREKMIINERLNEIVFTSSGAALSLGSVRSVGGVVGVLYLDRTRLGELSRNISAFSRDDSVSRILDEIEDDYRGKTQGSEDFSAS